MIEKLIPMLRKLDLENAIIFFGWMDCVNYDICKSAMSAEIALHVGTKK